MVTGGMSPIAIVSAAARPSPARVSVPTLTGWTPVRRLAHVHVDDDAQVVERGHRGVEHHEHRENGEPATDLERGHDHVHLCPEAGERRYADERQQEQRQEQREAGRAATEPRESGIWLVTPGRR